MGVKEIKDSFNLVANPDATASKALLDYKNLGGIAYQILTFQGAWSDGTAFLIRSDLLRPNSDPVLAARTTAAKLLAEKGITR